LRPRAAHRRQIDEDERCAKCEHSWLRRRPHGSSIDSMLSLESTSSYPAAPRGAMEKAHDAAARVLVAGGAKKNKTGRGPARHGSSSHSGGERAQGQISIILVRGACCDAMGCRDQAFGQLESRSVVEVAAWSPLHGAQCVRALLGAKSAFV